MEFGIRSILAAQKRGWFTFLFFITFFLLVVSALSLLPKRYEAMMIVVAMDANPIAEGTPSAGGLSLFGAGMSEKVTNFQMYLNVLQGQSVAEALMKRPDLLRELLSGWDKETKQWESSENVFDRWFEYPVQREPVVDDVIDELSSKIKVKQRNSPDFIPAPIFEISLSLRDGKAAEEILRLAHETADEVVRNVELRQLAVWQEFLQRQIGEISTVDAKAALTRVYSQYYTRSIMANVKGSFSAKVINGPQVANYPTLPRPMSLVVMAIIFGLIAGFALNFALYTLRHLTGARK